MDITPQDTTQQSISDDQELAKALAGVIPDAPEEAPKDETPAPVTAVTTPPATSDTPATPVAAPKSGMQFEETPVATPPTPATPPVPASTPAPAGDLDSIKKDALTELRPLIDKVDLPSEEKFDTYLMMIRSTDDPSLIAPAHAAAQGIADEKRRAEALLDIVKEIDYLSHESKPEA